MSDPWEDEGYATEDDWGAESLAGDLEEDALEPEELDDPAEPDELDADL